MTVSSSTAKVTRNGNDVATSFSFSPIVIFESTDLVVTKVSSAGVETVLSEGTSSTTYSVTVAAYPGTGTITYPASGGTPLATGESIIIQRVMPLEQETEFNNQGGYLPENTENQFDKLVMIDIQQQEELDRTLKGPVGFAGTFGELNTPVASRYVRRNSANDGYEHVALTVADGLASDIAPENVSLTAAVVGVSTSYSREDHVHFYAGETLPTASDTVAGIVELATTAETETGTDATRAVTPDGLHDMTSLAGAAWFLDEDNMASDSATKTASQQSIKAYVDGVALDQQVFDASGTWSKPASGTFAMVEVWGAGGGGGHYNAATGGGGGGGGGAYAAATILLSALSATETVTIGAGGVGALTGSTNGTIGGTSDFGALVYAYGGGGGSGSGNGGGGGGGGALSAGQTALATSGYPGGTPGTTVYATALGDEANSNGGGGGGGGNAAPSTGGRAVYGGGGGSGGISTTRDFVGGASYMGGGGGGGGSQSASSTSTGGASFGAGNGGAGGIGLAAGSDGVAPAGGGGGAQNVGAAKAGDGAAGRVRVTVW
ncbi:MAG: hypothetical protein O2884_08560 [Chloroflexi bacterium]|nr:hypothetical protein [Chloroflexota bacterium]